MKPLRNQRQPRAVRPGMGGQGRSAGPSTHQFFATCPRGLEGVLVDELRELGGTQIRVLPGGVEFAGRFELCYRVNLHSRVASRFLWRLTRRGYRTDQDLYHTAASLPWARWFSADQTMKVRVVAQHSPLRSLEFATLRIKDGICDRFRSECGRRPSVRKVDPDMRIEVFLDAREMIVYLDTSGEPLFKRGFGRVTAKAPLRENLAAGLLRLAGWRPEEPLLDPMCGSGTFLVEAAQVARGIPPGLGRPFAFERFQGFEPHRWDRIRAAAQASRTASPPPSIYGFDRSQTALEAARANLAAAGLLGSVQLAQGDVLNLSPPAPAGVLIMNPPYGVRSGDEQELQELYPRLGDLLKQRFAGWRAYIFTADLRLPKFIGLATSRRVTLFNGPLECRLYEFKLVHGSMKPRPRPQA